MIEINETAPVEASLTIHLTGGNAYDFKSFIEEAAETYDGDYMDTVCDVWRAIREAIS